MKSIKRFRIMIMAIALILAVSGCSKKSMDSTNSILQSGILKVAITDSDNYYTSLNGRQPIGMEPELVKTIATVLGVSTEYQILSKAAALEAVANGTADIAIGCISDTEGIPGSFSVTTSYGKGFYYAVTKKGDFAQTTAAFSDSVVGVTKRLDKVNKNRFYAVNGITLSEYKDMDAIAADIRSNRIRAYICMEDEARELLSDPNLQLQNMFDLNPVEYVIVAGSDDQTLINGMNSLIAQFLVKE